QAPVALAVLVAFDAANRVVPSQLALNREGKDRPEQAHGASGRSLAARHARKPMLARLPPRPRRALGYGVAEALDVVIRDRRDLEPAQQRLDVAFDATVVR